MAYLPRSPGGFSWGKEGVRREDEDSEEGGKAKGKEGVVRWGEEEGAGCKTKEAWPRH